VARRTARSSGRNATNVLVQNEWRRLVGWPALAFALAFAVMEIGQFDRSLARTFFYDAQTGWLGAGAGDWWAREVIHQAGRWLPRGAAAVAGFGWLASFRIAALGAWRRELLYVFCGMALVIASVGLMKELTNVDCPWDLTDFGGRNPYVPLFGHRPGDLKHAACFPAAHSSSGFALLAIYFALRSRAPRVARVAFFSAIGVGLIFAFGQEARGAHFMSHDITSGAVAWLFLVGLYSAMLAPRALQINAREGKREHAAGQAAQDIA
jgi:membrane-associated PAP2 superfamily phosphatase